VGCSAEAVGCSVGCCCWNMYGGNGDGDGSSYEDE